MEPNMSVARAEHESTILEDGTVLVTGGTVTPVPADLYDPSVVFVFNCWPDGRRPRDVT